ncbi:MAG: D-arabinose 5-phosphate isomerase [Deltaproteobacteria bacterium GWA2_57_13]|nr:MAG: D-arabinose 5-phosphate isomerase [Deltaproteobacteria bacterium GWA2_57_13]OGQ50233.1 MAG: D-arabinose 5-phosphate isomerase [Deltaproteobacteria bacterium RIFCSPLOWO2_02_FULL_57_26]OGQ78754.1 MAG: D-arabinose 5-phosphate isomerase [Deltaproteobacteria bacterium RIFCSPLOWO2_12_FULL_57_22]
MDAATILQRAREVLKIEAEGIHSLIDQLDESFVRAVDFLHTCPGKVVVTGMGKSGLICRKIAATFSSTGTPSLFLHAGDAGHGDLGMIVKGDVVLAISNSGETDEILTLLPIIKRLALKLIVITGNPESTLSRAGDVVLNAAVKEEACPLGLAPTTSTTAALALGDALAVVLLEKKGFKKEDFAFRHPGGILGRRLLLRVQDLMHRGPELPIVHEETPMKETLLEITSKRLGVTGVVNGRGDLVGVITDGDLRRGLEQKGDIFHLKAKDLMTRDPRTIPADALAARAVAVMEEHSITSLFVLEDSGRRPEGVVHLHDLLKAGIV